MAYQFALEGEVAESFALLKTPERLALITAFRSLAANPDQSTDADLFRCGFLLHEKQFGQWTLTYRLDVPVKRVLILAIRR
jgi:hypothetical protein